MTFFAHRHPLMRVTLGDLLKTYIFALFNYYFSLLQNFNQFFMNLCR